MSEHTVYKLDQPSDCPQHRWCAYTGHEPDRCPQCHSNWTTIARWPRKYQGGTPEQHLHVHQDRNAHRAAQKAREQAQKTARTSG